MKMFTNYRPIAIGFAMAVLLFSCDDWNNVPDFDVENVEGYKPIYRPATEAPGSFLAAREVVDPGKIYVINEYLLVVDRGLGVHVFDNTDSENPQAIGFLDIPGNNDVAVRNNILYADQGKNLIAIDINDLSQPKLATVIEDVFSMADQYPPVSGFYYECPDPSKGVLIGWELAILEKPKCYH